MNILFDPPNAIFLSTTSAWLKSGSDLDIVMILLRRIQVSEISAPDIPSDKSARISISRFEKFRGGKKLFHMFRRPSKSGKVNSILYENLRQMAESNSSG